MTEDPGTGRLGRRALLVAAGSGVVAASAFGVQRWREPQTVQSPTPGPPTLEPSPTPPTSSGSVAMDAVQAEARATIGVRLLASPWRDYFAGRVAPWSAMYVSWLLRALPLSKTAEAEELYAALARARRVGDTPEVGALVFYSRGDVERPHHVGFVDQVTDGIPQTIEGNAPANVALEERFVRHFARPWDRQVHFGYPRYG